METIIGKNIHEAKRLLDAGEVVAVPTETVYGLAGNALDEDAVLKIFAAKNRPQFNPLIIHLAFWKEIDKYVKFIPPAARQLALHFSPGPLTYLLKKKDNVPDLVTAGHDKVAVRIPAHPLNFQLLKLIDYPLAAPSANPYGYVSPTSAAHVMESLQGKIPYILDGGECKVGVESTIVDFEDDHVIIRRNGGIGKEEMEEVLGFDILIETGDALHPVAPGQLKSHYATHTPLFIGTAGELKSKFPNKKILCIGFQEDECTDGFNLSEDGYLDEAAKNLFSFLRRADEAGADLIAAALLPDEGIGRAVNDRLLRAQHTNKIVS